MKWLKIREMILERDGKKCVLCSEDGSMFKLVVHHIDNKKQNEPENLVTVCGRYHPVYPIYAKISNEALADLDKTTEKLKHYIKKIYGDNNA